MKCESWKEKVEEEEEEAWPSNSEEANILGSWEDPWHGK